MQRANRHHHHPHHAAATAIRPHGDRPSSSSSSSSTPTRTRPHNLPAQHINNNPPAKPDSKCLSLVLQALIMTLVIFLFFVFVGVAALVFLHIALAGGLVHTGRRSRFNFRSGFSPAELRALPRTRYGGAKSRRPDSKPKDMCAICLDDFKEGDWCRELPDCKHCFHSKCIDRWLVKVAGCPVCRTTVRRVGSSSFGDGESRYARGVEVVGEYARLWAVTG